MIDHASAAKSSSVLRSRGNGAVRDAVHQHRAASSSGALERLFTWAFSGLVYPQIWEDPVVDMEALALTPDCHLVTIASGGCNVLSYLTADPRAITALDLNRSHIAFNRLKLAAARHLPDQPSFHRFYAATNAGANVAAYHAHLRHRLDPATRGYWEARVGRRRRIDAFGRNIYATGLLGRFIGAVHLVARMHGVDLTRLAAAQTLAEQRQLFDAEVAPLFDRPAMRWMINQPASLFGLGIPPAQYHALAGDKPGGIAQVLRERTEKLACSFSMRDNYFAQQAFGRRYSAADGCALPPYLEPANYCAVRERIDRVQLIHGNIVDHLAALPARSRDRYVLLDAQDWMTDAQLNALWTEISRTAKPGARVLFRTAAEPDLLPGRVAAATLRDWVYHAATSRALTARDRSSIYGGVHLYTLADR